MDYMLIVFLPLIIALGLVTSYEDIKHGKIRNKYVLGGVVLGILIHIALLSFGVITLAYFGWIILYSLGILILGFLAWHIGWWSPGDAKLAAVFVLLVPLGVYRYATTQFAPIDLLVNSVIPIFLYVFVELLYRTDWKQKKTAVKMALQPKRLGISALSIFSISWVTMYIFQHFTIQPNFLLNVLMIVMIFGVLQKLFKEMTIPLLGLIALTRVFLNTQFIMSRGFLASFAFTVVVFIIVFGFLRFISMNAVNQKNVHQLEPGMLLSQGITKNGFQEDVEGDKKRFAFWTDVPLTQNDIKKIHKWHKAGHLHFNRIGVHHTTPFAPLIFLGVLITLICQGNMIMFLRAVLNL